MRYWTFFEGAWICALVEIAKNVKCVCRLIKTVQYPSMSEPEVNKGLQSYSSLDIEICTRMLRSSQKCNIFGDRSSKSTLPVWRLFRRPQDRDCVLFTVMIAIWATVWWPCSITLPQTSHFPHVTRPLSGLGSACHFNRWLFWHWHDISEEDEITYEQSVLGEDDKEKEWERQKERERENILSLSYCSVHETRRKREIERERRGAHRRCVPLIYFLFLSPNWWAKPGRRKRDGQYVTI